MSRMTFCQTWFGNTTLPSIGSAASSNRRLSSGASPDFSTNQVHWGCESAKGLVATKAQADCRNSPMQTECSTTLFEFAPVEERKVVADFGGGAMTSNAGALLVGRRGQGR